jgi:SAM-dependent methyltransferase
MEAAAYRSLRDLQDQHWWFVGRRKIIAELISRFVLLPTRARILEAGCGYGGNLAMLSRYGELEAFEFEDDARAYASTRLNKPVAPGHLPDNLSFARESFDLIAVLDVLEHIDDDAGSLRALHERLRNGGSILITVPAVPWLWSEHDVLHHHKRRYTQAGLKRVLSEAGFELTSVNYFNSLLFPLALVERLASRFFGKKIEADAMPHPFLNTLLTQVFALETSLTGRLSLPIGLSLYAVARKLPD